MNAEQAKTDLARRVREAAIRRMQVVKDRLCPVIEKRLPEIELRSQTRLTMEVTESCITVRGLSQTDPFSYRFTLSDPNLDSSRVLVRIFKGALPQRAPNSHSADTVPTGEACLLGVLNDVDTLARYELGELLLWLAESSREGHLLPLPQLAGVLQREEEERANEAAEARNESTRAVGSHLLDIFVFSRLPIHLHPRSLSGLSPAGYIAIAIAFPVLIAVAFLPVIFSTILCTILFLFTLRYVLRGGSIIVAIISFFIIVGILVYRSFLSV